LIFNFNTFNHCREGKIIVEDITRILGCQMQALGHEVTWDDETFCDGGLNVLLESFIDEGTMPRIAEAHARGQRFLIVATEEPTENGFNHGLEPAMIDRQNAFPAAARLAEGILCLMPGEHVVSWYAQHAPAAYVEIGHSPAMEDFGAAEPDVDFGFYGRATWRRDQILGHLGVGLRLSSLDVPRLERDAIMRRARVIVQVRANLEWQMVSNTRCATALNLGRPVIAEPHAHHSPWHEIVHFSDSLDTFYADARAALANWKDLHAEQMAKFRARLSPERCVGDALRKIGVC